MTILVGKKLDSGQVPTSELCRIPSEGFLVRQAYPEIAVEDSKMDMRCRRVGITSFPYDCFHCDCVKNLEIGLLSSTMFQNCIVKLDIPVAINLS